MNTLLNNLRRSVRFQAAIIALMTPGLMLMSPFAQANPAGGIVVHGDVTIGDGLNGQLQIDQFSDRAIINWQDFSISAGELTRFAQPGSGSAVLNRVMTGNPSALNGALQANGNVFVINPNGIVVGPNGAIDVGGLVLSTLDVSDADFLAGGDMLFRGSSNAGVTNFGRINAIGGDVFLMGQTVANKGSINASGTVGLAGGHEVLITANPDANGERVFVRPVGGGSQVENTGTIEGASVELKAHGNAYALAINNSGSIRATGATRANGGVFLRAPGGRVDNTGSIRASLPNSDGGRILIEGAIVNAGGDIDASGVGNGKGGTVDILGESITVPDGANIKADGSRGGTVTIGGAGTQTVNVSGGASVSANGSTDKGGTIEVQGADVSVAGDLSATGLNEGGGRITVAGTDVSVEEGSVVNASGKHLGQITVRGFDSAVVDGALITANSGTGGYVSVTSNERVSIGESGVINTGGENRGGWVLLRGNEVSVDGTVGADAASGNGGRINFNARSAASVGAAGSLSADGAEGGQVRIDSADGSTTIGGSISAEGIAGTGGEVRITGEEDIAMIGSASVNASGTDGGGRVFIGGGFQGNDARIRNAENTSIESGIVVRADATDSGNGGVVIIWSDGDTDFSGEVSAEGIGNGGLVEISGKERFGFDGAVSTLAANGTAGVLLLDPRNGEISSAAHAPLGSPFIINNVMLQTALGSNNVIVSTLDGGTFDAGNISILDRVQWDSAFSLTLLAEGDIFAGDDVINRGAGNINLVAGWDPVAAPVGIVSGTFFNSPAPVAPVFDMDTHIFNVAGSYGDNMGSVILGVDALGVGSDNAVVIGSRTGQTNVAGYDVRLIAGLGSTGENDYTQIGYDREDAGTATALAPSGRIKVHAINDVSLETDQTELANPDTGGAFRYAYAHIGHGGHWGSARQQFSGNIEVKAGQDITAQGGGNRQSFAMIGHGGSYGNDTNNTGTMSGTITVEATAGEINFEAGDGYNSFVQIGHGGREVRPTDYVGDTTINVKAGTNITFHAGHDRVVPHWNARESYAQLGHGGWSSNALAGGEIRGDIIVDAGGFIDFRAGDQRDNYASLGLGGRSTRGDFGHEGDITVTAGGDINIIAGTLHDRTESMNTDANDDGRQYAMFGHGGWDADANLNNSYVAGKGHKGDISVTTSAGNINILGGNSGRVTLPSFGDGFGRMLMAQIGHGGTATTGDFSGSIHVEATAGSINAEAGNANDNSADRYHSARIGHGSNIGSDWGNGAVATGAHSADSVSGNPDGINVIAGNAINFTGGPASALGVPTASNQNYVQLGLGGYTARGDHDGSISVTAGAGGINFTGGEGNPAANNQGNQNFALLGHGGTGSRGDMTGSITVLANGAGGINFQAGTALQGWVMLGHGGWDSDNPNNAAAPDAGNDGAIMVTTTGGGSINFTRGTNNDSYAQLGHGGRSTHGDHSGSITVNSSNGIAFGGSGGANEWGNDEAYVQLGHGGHDARGNHNGNISVTAGAGGITFDGGDTHQSYAQLGHGGTESDRPNDNNGSVDGSFGTIMVTTTGGGNIEFTGGGDPDTGENRGGRRSYAHLGHGGRSVDGNHGNDGTNDATVSAITVNSSGDIIFNGGEGAGDSHEAYAMIGHGGDESDGDHIGNISVTAAGKIEFTGGLGPNNNTQSFAMIGNGGYESDGNHTGDIVVSAGTTITFRGGRGTQNFAMIGNGGTVSRGDHSGDITVRSGTAGGAMRDITFQAGPGAQTWVQIGNGGWDADQPNQDPAVGNNGNILVTTNGGNLTFSSFSWDAGDNDNNDSYSQLGHGGRATSGSHFGTIDVDTRIAGMAVGGDIRFTGGDWYGYTQLGHGGFDALGNHGQDAADPDNQLVSKITVDSGGEIEFSVGSHPGGEWNSREKYAQLGHGGRGARGDHIGDIEVRAKESILVTGGFQDGAAEGSRRAYGQIGHGGWNADNPDGGNDTGVIDDSLNPFIGAGNTYLVDGYQGAVPGDPGAPGDATFYSDQARFGPTGAQRLGNRGNIYVESIDGAVVVTAGDQSEQSTQIGHGGYINDGDHSGNITVLADVDRSGWNGGAVIGANYNHDGDFNGDPHNAGFNFAPAIAGGGVIQFGGGEYRAGDILFDARGERQPGVHSVQLGHGGYTSSGGHDGDIEVRAGNEITFRAGRDHSFAKLGHGGVNNHPALNYGRVDGTGTANNNDDRDGDHHAGTIGTIGDVPGSADTTDPLETVDDTRNNGDDTWYPGTNTGSITVRSYGNIRFTGFTYHDINDNVGGAGWVQLGHGGWRMWADPLSDNGAGHNGDISVQAGDLTLIGGKITAAMNPDASIIFESGGQNDSWAHLGHGGFESKGNHFGDIEVAAANHVDFHARGGGTAADIGGQGTNADGGSPTNIWVRNHRAENSWVQLGHGGRNSTYSAALPRALESTTAAADASVGSVFDESSPFFTNATSLTVGGGLGGPVLASGSAADVASLPEFGHGSLQPLTTMNQAMVDPATVRFVDHDNNAATPPIPIIPPQTRGSWWQITAPAAPRDSDGNPIIALEGTINVVALNGDTVFQGAGSEDTPGPPRGETSPGSPVSDNGLGPHGARYGYVQVGHGGYESGGDHGSVDLDGSGTLDNDITIRSQNGAFYLQGARAFGNDDPVAEWHQGMVWGYGQVGHGGARSGGNMTGDITVVAAKTARMIAGAGEQTYVQIGHGGYDANFFSGPGELGFEPDTRVGNPGNVNDRRGAHLQNWYYPGYDVETNSVGGYIRTDFVADAAIAAGTGGPVPTTFGGRLFGVPDINGRRSRELFYNRITGDITVVGGGGVELRGGDQGHTGFDKLLSNNEPDNQQLNSGPNSYAQIGHSGRETQSHSINSNIVVDASGLDPTMGNMALPGASGGAVQVLAGNSTNTYAQIGHQGAAADGNGSGDITIRAGQNADGEGIVFRGGTWDDAYAQGGHGGNWSHSAGLNDVNGDDRGDPEGHSGNISLTAIGDILVIAGTGHRIDGASDIRAQAQIGHGGYDADVRQEQDQTQNTHFGEANITSPDGTTVITPGVGHNGDIHVVSTQGTVFVSAADIFRDSNHAAQAETITNSVNSRGFGGGRFNYAQIGHGGGASDGSHFGDIKVRAGFDLMGNATNAGSLGALSSDVIVLGGSSRGRRTFELQAFGGIGHGGWNAARGDVGSRDASGNATDTISVMAGRDVFVEGGVGRDSHAQIGNGGYVSRGDHAANIEVYGDRNVTVQGNQGDHLAGGGAFGYTIYEEAGGGNRNLDQAAVLADSGLGAGGVQLYDDHIVPGSVTFRVIEPGLATGAGLVFTDVRDSATSTTGTIQDSGGGVVGTINYVNGQAVFSQAILTSNNGGQDIRVDYRHSNAARSFAMIGNGGRDSDQGSRDTVGNTGDIRVTARTGHVVVRAGKDRETLAQIGHNGIYNQGTSSGNIVVRAAGDVNVIGGTGGYRQENRRNYAQIGHGGWDADGHHTGDIKVSSGSGALRTSIGDLLGDYNDLGDFNMDGTPDIIQFGADVSGTGASLAGQAGVGVFLRGGDFADLAVGGPFVGDDPSAQIGHGGRSSNGTKDGVIAVVATEGISLISGNNYRAWTQIGHGGLDGTLSYSGMPNLLSGNISVVADADFNGTGDLVLDAATDDPGPPANQIGFEGYALVGHGDDRAGGPGAGQRRGHTYVQGASIIVLEDGRNLAQVGHNSNDANDGLDFSGANPTNFTFIETDPGADITIDDAFRDNFVLKYLNTGGNATVGAGRDVINNSTTIYNSAGDYNLLGGRHVVINNSILNSGAGAVNLVAGFDFLLGPDLHFNDCPPGADYLDIAFVKANAMTWGNNMGAVNVGDGTQTAGIAAGSANGGTNALGYTVDVNGSNATNDAYAQIGYNVVAGGGSSTSGDIMVMAGLGGVHVDAGNANGAFAQTGHGGANAVATLNGATMIMSDGVIDFNGGNGLASYAQAGPGGFRTRGPIGDGIDDDVTIIGTSITFRGGMGQGAYVHAGTGGLGASGGLKQADVRITADASNSILFQAGNGQGAYAQAGNGGGSSGGGSLGNVILNAGMDISFLAGNVGGSAYAMGGNGGVLAGGIAGNANTVIEAIAGNDFILQGGGGPFNSAHFGLGGSSYNGGLNGTVVVRAGNDVNLNAGGATTSAVQIGGGGAGANGAQNVETLVHGDNDVNLNRGLGNNAYAKIGNGDQLFDSPPGFGGSGDRSGDIQVTAGTDVNSMGGMIGHVDASLMDAGGGGTPVSGVTAIASARSSFQGQSNRIPPNPFGPGSIIGDADSVFSAPDELRFFAPARANVQIANGASVGGVPFSGTAAEGTAQQANEFVIVALDTMGGMNFLNEHANLADPIGLTERWATNLTNRNATVEASAYNAANPAGFYFDAIVVPDAAAAGGNPGGVVPPPAPPAGGGAAPVGGGDETPPPFDAVYDSNGNIVPFENTGGLAPIGFDTAPNGAPVRIFGMLVGDDGFFLNRNGVFGFTPGFLSPNSPWVLLGPWIDRRIDDRLNDDNVNFLSGEFIGGVPGTFVFDFESDEGRAGMSSFDVWGESTFTFENVIVVPPEPVIVNPGGSSEEGLGEELGGSNP